MTLALVAVVTMVADHMVDDQGQHTWKILHEFQPMMSEHVSCYQAQVVS